MSTPKDGGPAFPMPDYGELNPDSTKYGVIYGNNGMSLRDYFAAKAMTAIIISTKYSMQKNARSSGRSSEEVTAAVAYSVADAMLATRERKEDAT